LLACVLACSPPTGDIFVVLLLLLNPVVPPSTLTRKREFLLPGLDLWKFMAE